MANYVDNSQINLSVNAKQANLVFDSLRQRAKNLEEQIDKAAKAGDKVRVKSLSRDFNQINKLIKQGSTETLNLEQAMRRLDAASPKELNKTLRQLQRQLNNTARGSEDWKRHSENIRKVKEEIARVNKEIYGQQSAWSRLNDRINQWQTAAMGAVAAVTGLVIAGKSAVQKYADMEQEMASVIKFTGMAADEVVRLNEEFKKIDTRSSREQLNQLAQEAGRLGKQSQGDVLGFVRAADKINVALDDLGEGATLTLSKLTGIFGDEERYGTEQSLIKVGSVINELSQNCSASAPYIANFTERLGGVGAQAGMTIQQIMGFAAVLDSNSQKVEASATALSQIIVRLYQDPAKYARVAGLEVEKFSKLMREDANSAVLLFLETLNKAGGMDVLSPMFKDMGENGSRAIAALSTLAKNIDAVKNQQKAANQAFEEGVSIDKEFAVQNNTVQASMDKARKSLNEIAIELGENLMPIMRHVYSSSTVMLKAMSTAVSFIKDNAFEISVLVAALVGYKAAAMAAAYHTRILAAEQAALTAGTKLLAVATKAGSAAIAIMTGNITKARTAWRALTASMSASPFAVVTAAVAALAVVIAKLTEKADEYADSARKIVAGAKEISQESVREQRELDILMGKLRGAKEGSKEFAEAKDKLISQYGQYLSGLVDEKGHIIDLSLAYDTLSEAVRRSAKERALAAAKDNLENAFVESASSDIASLQSALESFGASAIEASRLAQSVAAAVISGEQIPKEVAAKISEFSSGTPVANSEGKRYSNAGQRRFAKMGLSTKAPESPQKIVDRIMRSAASHDSSIKAIETMQQESNPSGKYSTERLQEAILSLDKVIREGSGSVEIPAIYIEKPEQEKQSPKTLPQTSFAFSKEHKIFEMPEMTPQTKHDFETMDLSVEIASKIRQKIAHELNIRGQDIYAKEESTSETESKDYSKEEKQSELNRRFREELKKVEAAREDAVEKATVENAAGLTDWLQFLEAKHQAEIKFYEDSEAVYMKWGRDQEEGLRQLLRKKAEEERSWNERTSAISIEDAKRRQRIEETMIRQEYAEKGKISADEQEEMNRRLFDVRLKGMQRELELTNKGSKDYAKKKEEIEIALADERLRIQQNLAKQAAKIEAEYLKRSPAEKLKAELATINELFNKGRISDSQRNSFSQKARDKYAPGVKKKEGTASARSNFNQQKADLDQMLADNSISQEEYAERIKQIQQDLSRSVVTAISQSGSEWVSQLANMYTAWTDFAEALKDPDADPFAHLSNGIQAAAAVMGSVMQSVSQLTNANVEIQTQAIEKRYEKEIAFAEGNSYLQAKLEKKKEKEIAKLKADASKKNFAMQVAMTVASTAANAVSAYGAALQIGGLAGLILAPVAAGMALAQGAVQIAVLKKQQQAAEASGYAEGGFTRKGRKDEPAGIVHAGEWVASQKLVNNPKTRPVIDMLEYAQRNNTVASLSMEDVSRSIAAPMNIAFARQEPQVIVAAEQTGQEQTQADPELKAAIRDLNERLNQPFVTINTMEGPFGIRQTQEEYQKLMRNKSK